MFKLQLTPAIEFNSVIDKILKKLISVFYSSVFCQGHSSNAFGSITVQQSFATATAPIYVMH